VRAEKITEGNKGNEAVIILAFVTFVSFCLFVRCGGAHGVTRSTAIGLHKQAVFTAAGNGDDVVGNDLLQKVGAVHGAVSQLTGNVPTHRPKAAVGRDEQTVIGSVACRDIRHCQRGLAGQGVQEQRDQTGLKMDFMGFEKESRNFGA
jgi:hypothetical protein